MKKKKKKAPVEVSSPGSTLDDHASQMNRHPDNTSQEELIFAKPNPSENLSQIKFHGQTYTHYPEATAANELNIRTFHAAVCLPTAEFLRKNVCFCVIPHAINFATPFFDLLNAPSESESIRKILLRQNIVNNVIAYTMSNYHVQIAEDYHQTSFAHEWIPHDEEGARPFTNTPNSSHSTIMNISVSSIDSAICLHDETTNNPDETVAEVIEPIRSTINIMAKEETDQLSTSELTTDHIYWEILAQKENDEASFERSNPESTTIIAAKETDQEYHKEIAPTFTAKETEDHPAANEICHSLIRNKKHQLKEASSTQTSTVANKRNDIDKSDFSTNQSPVSKRTTPKRNKSIRDVSNCESASRRVTAKVSIKKSKKTNTINEACHGRNKSDKQSDTKATSIVREILNESLNQSCNLESSNNLESFNATLNSMDTAPLTDGEYPLIDGGIRDRRRFATEQHNSSQELPGKSISTNPKSDTMAFDRSSDEIDKIAAPRMIRKNYQGMHDDDSYIKSCESNNTTSHDVNSLYNGDDWDAAELRSLSPKILENIRQYPPKSSLTSETNCSYSQLIQAVTPPPSDKHTSLDIDPNNTKQRDQPMDTASGTEERAPAMKNERESFDDLHKLEDTPTKEPFITIISKKAKRKAAKSNTNHLPDSGHVSRCDIPQLRTGKSRIKSKKRKEEPQFSPPSSPSYPAERMEKLHKRVLYQIKPLPLEVSDMARYFKPLKPLFRPYEVLDSVKTHGTQIALNISRHLPFFDMDEILEELQDIAIKFATDPLSIPEDNISVTVYNNIRAFL